MVLLHVVAINNDITSGVDVAVLQHIKAQSEIAKVAVVNVFNLPVNTATVQFDYRRDFNLNQLSKPFSKPDLVVFHNIYYFDFVKIAKKLKKENIPYIIIPHGALSQTAQRKKRLKKTAANLLFFNSFFKRAVAIQFLSVREKKSSKYNEKGFVGTNGIEIPECKKIYSQRDEIKIVFIGRIEVHIKGLDMLIEAVDESRNLFEQNNIHLDIYGPDHQGGHDKIKALILKHNVSRFVTLHDTVIGNKKKQILLDADVFIQTSRSEGMPMGILETLGYGVPCIVTEGTSLAATVQEYDAGWACSTNVDGIVSAINQAVRDRKLWSEKSEKARKLILENYVWDNIAEDTVKEYEKIVRKLRR